MEKLRKELGNFNYKDGILPMVSFEPSGSLESKILFIGSELGDLTSGTQAIMRFAHELKKNPTKNTKIDMIPVLDTEGYSGKRTIVGDEGFGRLLYMDAAYNIRYVNEQIKELCKVLDDTKYDLAVLLSSFNSEDASLFNGYFIMPQVATDEEGEAKKIRLFNERIHDLAGSILSGVNRANLPVLKTQNRYLGGGYMLLKPGVVLSGIKEGDEIKELRTKEGFLSACEYRGIPAIAAYALSSTTNNEFNEAAVRSHFIAMQNITDFYEHTSGKVMK